MSISRRIAMLVVLPAVAFIGIAGWILLDRWSTAMQMNRLIVGGAVTSTLTELVTDLQRERGRSALFLTAKGAEYGPELLAQQRETDARRAVFTSTARAEATRQLSANTLQKIQNAADALPNLDKIRAEISSQTINAAASTKAYTEIIERILDVSMMIVRDTDRTEVKNLAMALAFLQSMIEYTGLERATGAGGLATKIFSSEQFTRFSILIAEREEIIKLFKVFAPAGIQETYLSKAKAGDGAETARMEQVILKVAPGQPVDGIERAHWFKILTGYIDGMVDVQNELLRLVVTEARSIRVSAIIELSIAAGIIAVLVVFILGFGILTMRSITSPLKTMTETMKQLANGRLDCDVPAADRRDEIGAMASAVQIFKDNALRVRSLEAEQKEAEALAAATRRSEMQQLANQFEAKIGHVVGTVSAASAELEAAASTLTQTAENTHQLSGLVASASE
ncbi:MAG TPA: nitrate- and nitrite sensing domain-containing protein, partial [Xanthobacteraceae bacterium]|nr:nitrate- and nitrite sensing domain-containing protein [Xanthobacteraceae bacterium]